MSEHPLAKAIITESESRGINPDKTDSFEVIPGNGLQAVRNGVKIAGGNWNFISALAEIPESFTDKASKFALAGKTPLYFSEGDKFLGCIAVADVIKEDSPEAITELHQMGIRVVMLTGDNEQTAKAVGDIAGVDEVIAGVLPDGKGDGNPGN